MIAILRLYQPDTMKSSLFRCHMQDLTYSCLVFLSIYTTLSIGDNWYFNNVTEVMNSLKLCRSLATKTIEQMDYESHSKFIFI